MSNKKTRNKTRASVQNSKGDNAANNEMNDKENYARYLDSIDNTISASEQLIESRTFEIASGGLILSLTILSILKDSGSFPTWGIIPSSIIWTTFTLSIILHYWSQFKAKQAAEKNRVKVTEKLKDGCKYNSDELCKDQYDLEKPVRILNKVVAYLLVFGIFLLISFTIICFS